MGLISQDDPEYVTSMPLQEWKHLVSYRGNPLLESVFFSSSIMPQEFSFDPDSDWTLSEKPIKGIFSVLFLCLTSPFRTLFRTLFAFSLLPMSQQALARFRDRANRSTPRRPGGVGLGTSLLPSSLRGGVSLSLPVPTVDPFRSGQIFTLCNHVHGLCRGAIKGGKICARAKGDVRCSEDTPAHQDRAKCSLLPGHIYLRSARVGDITTVYEDYHFDATNLDDDLIAYLIEEIKDPTDILPITPRGISDFLRSHNVKTRIDFLNAVDEFTNFQTLKPKTPAQKRQLFLGDTYSPPAVGGIPDPEIGNDVRSLKRIKSLTQKAELLQFLPWSGAKDFGADAIDTNSMEAVAANGLSVPWSETGRDEFLVELGRKVDQAASMSGENAQATEAFGEAAVDRILELETTIRCHKTELDEVQASVGLAPVLENLTDDEAGRLPLGQSLWESVVQIAERLETCVEGSFVSGEVEAAMEILLAEIQEVRGHIATSPTTDNSLGASLSALELRIKSLESHMPEEDVSAEYGPYLLQNEPIGQDLFDISARLEEESTDLTDYLPVSCFVNPYMFLRQMQMSLYGDDRKEVGEVRHASSLGIQLVDFHMAQACLMDMPLFFDESRRLPQATYRSSTTRAGAKIKICPTAADFGQETLDGSVFFILLRAIRNTETFFKMRIRTRLVGKRASGLRELGIQMVERSREFVESLFRFMKTLNDELDQRSFGSGHEAWDLACFCVLELFNTELRPLRQKADGNGVTDATTFAGNARFLRMGVSVLKKIEEFLSVGLKNHPTLTAATVRFILTQSDKPQIKELTLENERLLGKLNATASELKQTKVDLKSLQQKCQSLQAGLDNVKSKVDELGRRPRN